ncbi:hypothetical protein V1508DRAFT_424983, partial [Lipomyces doorenjongii]|uniref:uncharacterized protein n=1 Tax=Lipomyces doorenjongii TaxID=383834 RepID=UPI0034CD378E
MTSGLNPRGDIAVAEIVVYSFLLVISGLNCVRFGFKHQDGWIFLSIFCMLRLVASALVIVVEESSHPSTGIIVAEITVNNIALTPLHMAALGFLTTCVQLATSDDSVPSNLTQLLRISRLALITSIVLGIIGATQLSNNTASTTGHALSKASVLVVTAVYCFLAFLSLYLLGFAKVIGHSRMLVTGVILALPFLGVRIIYSILSAFSSSASNSKFSSATGSWQIYLGMDVIMEFVVVAVLTVTGLVLASHYGQSSVPHSDYELANRKGNL